MTDAKLLARTTEYMVCWKFSKVMTFKYHTKQCNFNVQGSMFSIFMY